MSRIAKAVRKPILGALNVTPRTIVRGEITYPLPGTYSFIVPDNVYSICVVTIAGGGGAKFNGEVNDDVASGAGGGLAWVNRIPVKPGDDVEVIVGKGGNPANVAGSGTEEAGGDTKVTVNGVVVCHASGGGPGVISGPNATGGSKIVGDGGGNGGDGAYEDGVSSASAASGGAGPGYTGNGGDGVEASAGSVAGNNGAGGGAGSGGVSTSRAAGSGGTGLNGEGDSGTAGPSGGATPGLKGSDGEDGSDYTVSAIPSGKYGAGGGAVNSQSTGAPSHAMQGTNGGARILWGPGREFPATDVGQS